MISRRVFWKVQAFVTLAILLVAAVQDVFGSESRVWMWASWVVLGQVGGAAISDVLIFRRTSVRPRQTSTQRHEDWTDHLVKAAAWVLGGLALTAASMFLLTYVAWFVTAASWALRGLWVGLVALVLVLAWWGLTRDMET